MIARVVVAASLAGVAALAYGPVRAYVDDDTPAPSILDVRLADPTKAPQLPRWPLGVVDTAEALPGAEARIEPPALPVTYAEAAVLARRADTVSVVGPPGRAAALGVGAVVTDADVEALAALPEPERTRVVRLLAAADGAALSVTAVGGVPDEPVVVRRTSADADRALLDAAPEVRDLLRVWTQLRPELSALVDVDGPGLDPSTARGTSGLVGADSPATDPAGAAWRRAVARASEQILLDLDRGYVPLSTALLAERSPAGLVDLDADGSRLTARGAAYGVAARVVQPGSRPMAVRVTGPVQARAYARPGGGAGLLLWNPARARTVSLLLPVGKRVLRLEVRCDAQALTGVVLGPR